jgi:hypothetical protein
MKCHGALGIYRKLREAVIRRAFAARLKSCPDTKHEFPRPVKLCPSLESAACEPVTFIRICSLLNGAFRTAPLDRLSQTRQGTAEVGPLGLDGEGRTPRS